MSIPTTAQVQQALNHLVSIEVSTADAFGNPMEFTLTGLLRDVFVFEDGHYQADVTTGFGPGSYDEFAMDTIMGSAQGLLVSTDEIVSFTDHGARDDFDTNLAQLVAQREHALQALKDAEKNLHAAYQVVTNLTAQEG